MTNTPHEVARLGEDIQSWVEQQLLNDLKHYGIQRDDLVIDWSSVTQEGHWTEFRDRILESLSEVFVRDTKGNIVAEGWMDFVETNDSIDSEPRLFWLFLDMDNGAGLRRVKEGALLPTHVWESMSPEEKNFVVAKKSKWLSRDPKVQAWQKM